MVEEFSELLKLARGGDRDALSRLVEQYEKKLRVVARVQLGPALRPYLDSQDLVQSVHRSLMAGLRDEKFDVSTPDQLIALTITMLRRKIARLWRRMRRQERIDNGSGNKSDVVDLLTSISAPRSEPEAEVEFRDSVSFLCQQMDETERNILDLRLQGFAAPDVQN